MDYLPKPYRDDLVILYYGIDRHLDPESVKWLEARGFIERLPNKSWRVTGSGRERVRQLKVAV